MSLIQYGTHKSNAVYGWLQVTTRMDLYFKIIYLGSARAKEIFIQELGCRIITKHFRGSKMFPTSRHQDLVGFMRVGGKSAERMGGAEKYVFPTPTNGVDKRDVVNEDTKVARRREDVD